MPKVSVQCLLSHEARAGFLFGDRLMDILVLLNHIHSTIYIIALNGTSLYACFTTTAITTPPHISTAAVLNPGLPVQRGTVVRQPSGVKTAVAQAPSKLADLLFRNTSLAPSAPSPPEILHPSANPPKLHLLYTCTQFIRLFRLHCQPHTHLSAV